MPSIPANHPLSRDLRTTRPSPPRSLHRAAMPARESQQRCNRMPLAHSPGNVTGVSACPGAQGPSASHGAAGGVCCSSWQGGCVARAERVERGMRCPTAHRRLAHSRAPGATSARVVAEVGRGRKERQVKESGQSSHASVVALTSYFFFSSAGGSILVSSGGPVLRLVYCTSELSTRSRNFSRFAPVTSSSLLAYRVRLPG